jgi:uncharacterized coiled-coil protein SlyX
VSGSGGQILAQSSQSAKEHQKQVDNQLHNTNAQIADTQVAVSILTTEFELMRENAQSSEIDTQSQLAQLLAMNKELMRRMNMIEVRAAHQEQKIVSAFEELSFNQQK